MNKSLLNRLSIHLLLFLLLSAAKVDAQSFTITNEQGDTINDTEITVLGEFFDATLSYPAFVTNSSTDADSIKCRRRILQEIPQTTNYFCWGICYGPSVNVGNQFVLLNPGESYNNFHAYFTPDSMGGTCRIMYVFYDMNNPSDSANFTVKFEVTPNLAGIKNNLEELPVKLYPTASSQNIILEMESNSSANILIHDMAGKEHMRRVIQNTRLFSIDVEGLSQGMYQVLITDAQSGKRSVRRFIRQ